jgi:hypothetical protein
VTLGRFDSRSENMLLDIGVHASRSSPIASAIVG